NIFWKFVGIGDEKFEFLERLDTMSGRFIDNANFIKIDNLNFIKDSSLYEMLLTEFSDWCRLCREHNLI
ncbi:MAG: VWA domain-containing protein, partial [Oscillospiraceae bacterium]|nr:VWA domain-containing protein [Oscillospiraceae bacterium]